MPSRWQSTRNQLSADAEVPPKQTKAAPVFEHGFYPQFRE